MAQLNINDEQMQKLVAGAVLQVLTPESREKLISDAIVTLLTPARESYSSSPAKSPLQKAFEYAVEQQAHQLVREHLKQDDMQAKVLAVIVDATTRAFGDEREKLVTSLASGIAYAFTPKRD